MLESGQITVIRPGWFTTIQDTGRYGSQQYGVSVSGAMDRRSLVIGNRLVGNCDDTAALELTLKGPELLFAKDTIVAITGADLSPSVNGTALPLWTSLLVKGGSVLSFGLRRGGARGYLSVAGGIEVPKILGSRSTHVSSKTGGIKGRALIAGDVVNLGAPLNHQQCRIGKSLPESSRPIYLSHQTLRILEGPQLKTFAKDAFGVLTGNPYRLSTQSDRMGYRLEGPTLPYRRQTSYISDGTAMGALQVPSDGQPILLMADRQTTGGYPKIAVVIAADLHLAGQLLPGDSIQFRSITLEKAKTAFAKQWDEIGQTLPPCLPITP